MTQNPWPQDGSYGTLGATQQTAVPNDDAYPATPVTSGTPSKSETAKHEAGDVAHQAADSAQHVAETAKAEAANVAGEVKANAKDLMYTAKADLADQAGVQQQKVAQGLHSISGELRTMADASEQPGVATDLIRQAADRSASVASWLEGRDPGSLLNEVKTFARQRPGTFLLLAAGAGILAGRLTRSLSEGAPSSASGVAGGPAARAPISSVPGTGSYAQGSYVPGAGSAVPPPPVQLPGPDVTTAGMTVAGAGPGAYAGADAFADADAGTGAYTGASDAYPADTYPPNPLADEGTAQDQWADDPMAGNRVAESPLAGESAEDDPYRDDPLRGGQR
ncbi:hypothetical protein FCN77_01880 [Arthrobacter sp. 24S4-2]|uniref:hypothetical protein n=1 Tax=Arthrobacter sp. 24S4-2 TaxID=2575374 RepID=UPI0010C78029|nr:hypothetical protein [Arthrobacter sp. 24S4-2]QCO96697.1 hypothetical protein FCN77_01880 [Arthrobacter sp. 24S4-2]